jgi:hypothetical protein
VGRHCLHMGRATSQLFSALVVCLGGIALCPPGTRGHDWYPMECCHQMDCAPVESADYTTAVASGDIPQWVVTTRHGSAVVPQNIPLRESKDKSYARMYEVGGTRPNADHMHFRPTQQLNVDRSGCRPRSRTWSAHCRMNLDRERRRRTSARARRRRCGVNPRCCGDNLAPR